jgi:UDP-2,3-diacylglucosamine hydrolase
MEWSAFVSDLHLTDSRPAANETFRRFLEHELAGASALYILGDFFEYWIGDDDLAEPFHAEVAGWLARAAARLPVWFMHGNRDFLVAGRFARETGVRLVEDGAVRDLHGTPTLLMHGDLLCTDDLQYQSFRRQVRASDWQRQFLGRPLAERRAEVLRLRELSTREKASKSEAIMDVNAAEVERVLREHGVARLIHGHTHRPARHELVIDGRACERWVLTDWYGRAGYLRADARGCTALALPT